MSPPQLFYDCRLITGLFGFYRNCLPWYEEEVIQRRKKTINKNTMEKLKQKGISNK